MRSRSSLPQEKTHDDCGGTAYGPKECTILKMQVQVRRGPDTFANVICVNRSQERGNPKYEEINPSSCAALYTVRIDLLDDTIGNHRGARCDAEEEHRDVGRNWEGFKGYLGDGQNHERRASNNHRLSPSNAVRKPSKQRTSKNPAKGNHRSDDHCIVIGKLQVFLKCRYTPS